MSQPTTSTSKISESEQRVLNMSMDDAFKLLAVMMIGYDGTNAQRVKVNSSGELVVSTSASPLATYVTNDIDDGDTTTDIVYIGKEDKDGAWAIQKIDSTTSTLPTFQYATVTNNAGTTTYSTAWTNRASLTYQDISSAF